MAVKRVIQGLVSQNYETRLLPSSGLCLQESRLSLDGLYVGQFFRKSVEKIQVSLKSDKNNGYFT